MFPINQYLAGITQLLHDYNLIVASFLPIKPGNEASLIARVSTCIFSPLTAVSLLGSPRVGGVTVRGDPVEPPDCTCLPPQPDPEKVRRYTA